MNNLRTQHTAANTFERKGHDNSPNTRIEKGTQFEVEKGFYGTYTIFCSVPITKDSEYDIQVSENEFQYLTGKSS
jgi:hypothetical protein